MRQYGWWISYSSETLFSAQPGEKGWASVWLSSLVGLVLGVPPVAELVGVEPRFSVPLVLLYPAWCAVCRLWVLPRARRSAAFFHLMNGGDIFLGVFIAVALPIASGDPASPLWTLAVLFAGLNGADYDYGPSLVLLLTHTLSPLFGIPFYLAGGVALGPAVGGPVFYASVCLVAYHYNAVRRTTVRGLLQERDALRRELAEEQALREKERLARDLHDSVGASLSVAALYAEKLAKNPDRETTERLSRAIAEVARGGLGELRGLLDALSPDQVDLQTFGVALDGHARRVALGAGVDARVSWEGEEGRLLPSALRFEVAKVFQEALHNSLRHAGARRIEARLASRDGALRLVFEDDGCGLEPSSEAAGRGIKGMRRRVEELGGNFSVGAGAALGGARLQATFPLEG